MLLRCLGKQWAKWMCLLHPKRLWYRQWPISFFGDRKDNAYALYGQYSGVCDTLEKWMLVCFSGTQLQTHESNDEIQTLMSPVSGTNPDEKPDHHYQYGDNAQPLVYSNIGSHQADNRMSQIDDRGLLKNQKIFYMIPTIVSVLITHLIFSINPIIY